MPRFASRPALGLLGAHLCLAACAPTASMRVVSTATTTLVPTATTTLVLAPPPTSIPPGWKVLATTHFSLAYPPDWTSTSVAVDKPMYTQIVRTWAPVGPIVQVVVVPHADVTTSLTPYCRPGSSGTQSTTFANLPMTFAFTGLANMVRVWTFANAQQTWYQLAVADVGASAAVQAQDTAVLAMFRPDDATPWRC